VPWSASAPHTPESVCVEALARCPGSTEAERRAAYAALPCWAFFESLRSGAAASAARR